MDQDGKTGSGGFWTSLPAILGSTAALVTAVGGIFIVSNQRGAEPHAAPANVQTAGNAPAAPANAQSEANAPVAATPIWPDISGRWLTDEGAIDFTDTDLRDDEGQLVGKKVHGSYAAGRIDGDLQGFTLHGYWSGGELPPYQCASERNGSRYWGRIEFQFNRASDKFQGHWGVCEKDPAIRWRGARG